MSTKSRRLQRLLARGNKYSDRGAHRKAIRFFQRAIDQGDRGAALNLGNSLIQLGDIGAAIAAYRLAWKSGDVDSGYNLGLVLEDSGDTQAARAVYVDLASHGHSPARIQLAWMLRLEGDEAGAVALLHAVVAADDGAAGDLAAGTLGHWLHITGDQSPSTVALLTRGIDAYPTARVDLSAIMSESKRPTEALDLLQTGVAHGEVESMIPLANQYWNSGDLGAAAQLLRRAVELGDHNAAENLQQLQAEMNKR